MNTDLLNNLIVGRVEPHIYAFSTETIPNYLKIGDTYRPVLKRLEEWRRHFPDLKQRYSEVAKVNDDVFFRDHSVHRFLERDLKRIRLQQGDIPNLPYYSCEFFRDANEKDLSLAIKDIQLAYQNNSHQYVYYTFDESRVPLSFTYERTESYAPRPNQEATIEAFKQAISKGRTNLLMYAVMRFGKSFTAMCCALEMQARLVLVVSAKADVKEEWKRTVQSHVNFKDYDFLDSSALLQNGDALTTALSSKRAVVFLTLQDLMGDAIKEKHRELFEQDIDLLLIDESHYGARAEKYGEVLQLNKRQVKKELEGSDYEDATLYESQELKALKAKIRIHLSGTPYRILMGSEFEEEDIIAFYQFSDIVEAQEAWDKEHILSDEVKEWDNPYYGFPQMIRFAFHPNQASMDRLKEFKDKGFSAGLSKLFRPCSIEKDRKAQKHKEFIHQDAITDLLFAIDGYKEDQNILPFLALDEIQRGKMCRHLVFVLPFKASCDAMEALLLRHKDTFCNLGSYQIVNISGWDSEKRYKTVKSVKEEIEECERSNIKTITLTMNRMLTGSTVKEWDTMLFFKDSSSPQEYDQAVFRLQNQYVRSFVDEQGECVKYNMKPQTLLVDFAPDRMFRLQEQRAQIYNVNTDKGGNDLLRERLETELRHSPIVTIGHQGLQQVSPSDIMDAVRDYSASRSVMDEACDIPIDYALLDDQKLLAAIAGLKPIDTSNGIQIRAVEGDEADLDIEPNGEGCDQDLAPSHTPTAANKDKDDDSIGRKLATYYAQILFYAFLTDSPVASLAAIIRSIEESDENKRIARNVGLKRSILRLIQSKSNLFVLRALDYKIENLNSLMRDENLQPMRRVEVAMTKFGRLSSSEIVTPQPVAMEMINALDEGVITAETKILDIASKQGEFTRALYTKYGDEVKDNIYALPTSPVAYEFTCKVYKLLGLSTEHIIADFNSYDLLNEKKEELMKKLKDMNFDFVIGNPPYQENIAKTNGNKSLSKQLYPKFLSASIGVTRRVAVLITPSRWFTADGQDNSFPVLRSYIAQNNHISKIYSYNGKSLFPDIELGDVSVVIWDRQYQGNVTFKEHFQDAGLSLMSRPLFEDKLDIILPMNSFVSIMEKVVKRRGFVSINSITTGRDVFGVQGKNIEDRTSDNSFDGAYRVMCAKEKIRYISPSEVKKNSTLRSMFKVFISKANGAAGLLTDGKPNAIIGKSFVAEPNDVCTDSLIVLGGFPRKTEAENLSRYLSTRFLRFMVGILKVSHNLYQNVYRFVPLQDFTEQSDIDWSRSIEEIDQQLYAKYGLSEEEIAFIESKIKPMK